MTLSIQGKVAIVTGAARGVGLAIARHFVERGAMVMFADCEDAALAGAVSDYDNEGTVQRFAGDMSEKLVMANLLSATLDAFDRVDILVNAHRFVRDSDPLATDMDTLEEMLRQNLMSQMRLSQLVAKRMIRQSESDSDGTSAGAIVNISTLAARRPIPSMLGYSIACAAQEQATRGLALALAPHRIRVNGVSFSSVMSHELQCALKADPEKRSQIIAGTPMGRIAPADEVAETAQYLVSDGARFVTGQIVTVDGGRSLADPVTAQIL
ncbi:SDR family oxidoreductase [Paracoccus sp. 1_MG-2023]|uniref:SDR family NAD(P)-dependent oxidoreductase n=1 Tax=unclassified Paracoccus (in: a-proteobacteria) TaxID=2688777 RepID=UPI001C07F2FC|nr:MULTISPECIES: SDR family oxidoreductase [unclassified Paracoccus (in: a-proteobacteria)]MBU2958666.1 SDR family oxidoreductase [Paracoccus sp. C2R09]MDO6667659.1 SDR family oxidoreductase [Paracoccus sp. 1_MG-2023]